MTAEKMAAEIIGLVRERGGALFHEMVLEIGYEAEGDFAILLNDNVLLWNGISETFAEAFNLAKETLDAKRANPGAYAFFSDDLGFPNLPVVTMEEWAEGKLEYDTMHWLPLVFFLKKGSTNEQANIARNFFSSAPVSGVSIIPQASGLDSPNPKT